MRNKRIEMLEREYEYFEANKKDFIENHNGQYVIIQDSKVFGFFGDKNKALEEALNNFDAGTFLIKECIEESDNIMRFHSRVNILTHA